MSTIFRKNQHLKLSKNAQTDISNLDNRFSYEPMLSSHNINRENFRFLGYKIGGPIFISSMTGGSYKSVKINKRLVKAAKEFSIPMGLGSIRPYLENFKNQTYNFRELAGDTTLLFGNLGISQLEQLLKRDEIYKLERALNNLNLDGLIIHINPLQEWVQFNGDRLENSPNKTLSQVLPLLKTKIIVKEVGAGFGINSLESLLNLPIDCLDLAGFGGTNFTKIELLRGGNTYLENNRGLIGIGNSNKEMIKNINYLYKMGIGQEKEIIISGGIKNSIDGYYYKSILKPKSIFGYAFNLLEKAKRSEKKLFSYIENEIQNYCFAENFLRINEDT